MNRETYLALADAVLLLHLLYIAWVIFGALFTRRRPWLAAVHIATILWGIIAETTSAPCPLTLAENWCETRAGMTPYRGSCLLHYLDATVYPNVATALLVTVAVAICVCNLAVYVQRFGKRRSLG